MSKYTTAERALVKYIVAPLSIKRIPEAEIINAIFNQTNKTIIKVALHKIRQIKRESFKWYKTMREGEYEYIHEFKERINEIMSLQKKHHEIIDSTTEPTTVKQTSLAELHRLNITLSNYFDVAPSIINGNTLSTTHNKAIRQQQNRNRVYRLIPSILKYSKTISGYGIRKNIRQLAKETNGQCCWNHIVGLPQKDKKEYPLFDYEKILYDTLLFSVVTILRP